VFDQVLLHGRLGDHEALVTQPIGVLATADGGLEHGQGEQAFDHVGGGGRRHLGRAALLGHERLEAIAVGHVLPLVVAGPAYAKGPTRRRHVAGLFGQCQHGEAPAVDDLCVGHGDGLLGSVEGTTESIAGPLNGVDVQPQHSDRKA